MTSRGRHVGPASTARETLATHFKDAFRAHPAGVAVITAAGPDGPLGLTASSVASVSVEPVALSFSVARTEGSAGGILDAASFVVHLVSGAHVDLASSFAISGAPRFTPAEGWTTLPSGEPYLPSAPVAFRARAVAVVPSGAARLVLAEVLDVHHGHEEGSLLYRNRAFTALDAERVHQSLVA